MYCMSNVCVCVVCFLRVIESVSLDINVGHDRADHLSVRFVFA